MKNETLNFLWSAIFIIAVTCFLAIPAFGQNNAFSKFGLDFSGVDAFWRVYEVLKNDREPTAEEWDAMFSTPGYALVESKERRRNSLTEAFKLAYMPSKISGREAVIKNGKSWMASVLPHLIEIPSRRKELDAFLQGGRFQKLFTEARRRAQEFLPDKTTELIPPPGISLVYFQSRGYERILLDPLRLMQHPDAAGLVGHELHHYYRNKIARKSRPFGEDMLAWAIANVEVEGVAGNVDKGDIPKMNLAELEKRYVDRQSLNYFRQYQIEYARSNEWLKFFENHLEQIADNPEQKKALGAKLHAELPDNGRAMGTFMTKVIIKQLGKKRFLKTIGDSFAFWDHYNAAAKRSNGQAYVLSERAMNVIARTDDEYRGK